MQRLLQLNAGWLYKPYITQEDRDGKWDPQDFEAIDLPHTNCLLPGNCLDERSSQFVSCYARQLSLPDDWEGKDVLLDFEGVALVARVYCNGSLVCEHKGGFTPFTADLTPYLRAGADNRVVVEVDSTERPDVPPYGRSVDFLTYGGIYREVRLRLADCIRIENVRLEATDCLSPQTTLNAEVELLSDSCCQAELVLSLLRRDGTTAAVRLQAQLPVGRSQQRLQLTSIGEVELWDIHTPSLYTVQVSLDAGIISDSWQCRFGFRESCFKTDGYYLNGKRLPLVGLNRHQSYPYVGFAMPARVQRRDAQLLKEQAGVNIVRTSHYPQSRHFLDCCDELGLLVIEEIPGWQHIGDEAWQEVSLGEEAEMLRRDRNRPSIILWGVRINESQDNHSFYSKTNALAHKLDPTRQTGGIRYILHSEFLEDVYTYNDFTCNGGEVVFRPQRESTGLDHNVPTLVTESMGHMFPTKSFDNEERRVEHALRHMRIINESCGRDDIAGGISWCAFDYNTHSCFGSGDKVCYHGVYDQFRNPKYAAFAYESQRNPSQGIVLEPITVAARGERDGGGIVPFYLLTNCDFVRVSNNGRLVDDFYPSQEQYPHLEHPPICISHLMYKDLGLGFSPQDDAALRGFLADHLREGNLLYMGEADREYLEQLAQRNNLTFLEIFSVIMKSGGGWGDGENLICLEGFAGGKPVCRRMLGEQKHAGQITLTADDEALCADGDTYDATRFTVRAPDNWGNLMPYTQDCVTVTLRGPARLMGPSQFALTGGSSAFWVRTTGRRGAVTVRVQGSYSHAEYQIKVL